MVVAKVGVMLDCAVICLWFGYAGAGLIWVCLVALRELDCLRLRGLFACVVWFGLFCGLCGLAGFDLASLADFVDG